MPKFDYTALYARVNQRIRFSDKRHDFRRIY